jgi:excisionase family DNA binding protein
MSELKTVREASLFLACSEAAIRKWIAQGKLPAVKVGRLRRLRLEDLERVASVGLDHPQRPSRRGRPEAE